MSEDHVCPRKVGDFCKTALTRYTMNYSMGLFLPHALNFERKKN